MHKILASCLKLIVTHLTILIIFIGCNGKGLFVPPIQNQPDTTSHNFIWTADTIWAEDALQIYLYDIWGTDENNVYAVGHSDWNKYRIWHYDGQIWNNINVQPIDHVPTYSEIFGFDKNDFWIVGYGVTDQSDTSVGYILHYDGSWHRMDNRDLPSCWTLWGSSPDNMYFGCKNGIFVNYNGKIFKKYTTNIDTYPKAIWGLSDTTIYSINVSATGPIIYYLFKYSCIMDSFIVVDESDPTEPGFDKFDMDLWGYDNHLYSGGGDGLTRYVNGEWELQFWSTTIYSIFGNSSNNIFAGCFGGVIYHYNGSNWKRLDFGDNCTGTIWGIWCNENYVFIIQDIGSFGRIVKGKRSA
jgi:hypothetical protein